MATKKSEQIINLTVEESKLWKTNDTRLQKVKTRYGARDDQDNKIEKIFLMDWDTDKPDATKAPHIKHTVSPVSRSKALGAIRMLTATTPKIHVPFDKNDTLAKTNSEMIEKAALAILAQNARLRQNWAHYDMMTSAVLFGEFFVGIDLTVDMLANAEGTGKSAMKRMERIASITPAMYEVFDPRTCYPEYDEFGMSSIYRAVTTRVGTVIDRWGTRAFQAGLKNIDRAKTVEIYEFWDNVHHMVWTKGADKPLMFTEHDLPTIPIISQITDGSSIHSTETAKRQPFLYSVLKSGLADRQNLMMTIAFSTMFAIASNPTFKFTSKSKDRKLTPDYSVPGGFLHLLPGEDYAPLAKNAIDPSISNAWGWSDDQITQATIYDAALGKAQGANVPFATTSILNQAGRLPLITLQRRGSLGIARILEATFELLKHAGKKSKVIGSDGGVLELNQDEIPEPLIIEANLDIDLPQDMKQNVALAQKAIEAGLMDVETARQIFVNIEQNKEIDKKIVWDALGKAKLEMMIKNILMPPQPMQDPEQPMPTGGGGSIQRPDQMVQNIPDGQRNPNQPVQGSGEIRGEMIPQEPREPIQ